ncbi:hypothetical protein D3C85_1590060 [compost metagenome]
MRQWGIGANGRDQRWLFQHGRVKHRSTGRGAEHDDIRIVDGAGEFGMKADARIDIAQCLLLGLWQRANIGRVQPDIHPFAQRQDMPGMSLTQPPCSHHGQFADTRRRQQVYGERCGSRGSLDSQLS